MKLASWNVNGIRAASRHGFLDWLQKEQADVVSIQETKANKEQLDAAIVNPDGYKSFWHSAKKSGYSGVAIYSKVEPISVNEGLGLEEFDSEGRVLVAEFPLFTLINSYFPNSQRDHARLDYKLRFCSAMGAFCETLRKKGKNLVLAGDFNIAHTEIDLKFPKANENNAGFLPQERAWIDAFLKTGYVDSFRHFDNSPGNFTWWSYRPGVREKNIGWRLDYHLVNSEFRGRLKNSLHRTKILGSDHCPVILEITD